MARANSTAISRRARSTSSSARLPATLTFSQASHTLMHKRRRPAMAQAALMLLISALLACAAAKPATACGPDSDCVIGDRHYRIRMPASHDGHTPVGAIAFAHGYTGNAQQAMRDEAFAAIAAEMNVAIISGKSAYRGWSLPGAPSRGERPAVDELAYWDRVIDDAARRFPIDRKRLLASGFSAGGMMVWNLACHRSTRFAGFAPISGTFWAPVPPACTTPPASIVHLHGDADTVVPLLGRPIGSTKQGAVPDALDMYARYGRFGPSTMAMQNGLRCENQRSASGAILNFCLFEGGHIFDPRHIREAWQMLAKAGKL